MSDRVGQQPGKYQLLNLIGKGSFAEVYLGEHLYLKRPSRQKRQDEQETSTALYRRPLLPYKGR
ncbi:MAG TPA: hypothetical protein VF026_20140 [Ktedonobacteraceae bacterium]